MTDKKIHKRIWKEGQYYYRCNHAVGPLTRKQLIYRTSNNNENITCKNCRKWATVEESNKSYDNHFLIPNELNNMEVNMIKKIISTLMSIAWAGIFVLFTAWLIKALVLKLIA